MDEWKHNSLLCAKHLFGATSCQLPSSLILHMSSIVIKCFVFLTKFLL